MRAIENVPRGNGHKVLPLSVKEYQLLDGSVVPLVQRVGDGSIITRFDKTPSPKEPTDVVCPHFLELKWATGCPYRCSWCYLNGTLRFLPQKGRPRVKDYGKIALHVHSFLERANGYPELLNAGELADSLMWEQNGSPFSRFILDLFKHQERHKVLFVTKSAQTRNLLEGGYQKQAIISFSINANPVAQRFETGAPPIEQRIIAAAELQAAGYDVRIRIDPLVPIANWERHYLRLIDLLFARLIPSMITLGSLRGLQSTINQARDKSWVVFLGERSNWGRKVRFDTRLRMYERLLQHLRDEYDYGTVSLCKETSALWDSLGMDYRRIRCNCLL